MKNFVQLLPELQNTVVEIRKLDVSGERKEVLQSLIDFVQDKVEKGEEVNLNFICTHNSRRSQFSQIWAQTAAFIYGVPVRCFSGGVEVTAFNERAVRAIENNGFQIEAGEGENPLYQFRYASSADLIHAFSKVFDDKANKADGFAAVMTCDHADANCPFIPGAEKRIPVMYDDPKAFDGTPQESEKYDERSRQIASEMLYVFANIQLK